MKVGAVSGDLVVKLAVVAGVIAAAAWAARRAGQALPDFSQIPARLWNTATDAAHAISPWNQQNVVYQAANGAASGALGYPETVGGAAHDLTAATGVQPWAWLFPPIAASQAGASWLQGAYSTPAGPAYSGGFDEPTYDALGNRTN